MDIKKWIYTVAVISVIIGVRMIVLWYSGELPHKKADSLFAEGLKCENKIALVSITEEERKKSRECAITNYEEAIQAYDKDWRYFFRLAEIVAEENSQKAIELYLTANRLNPSEPGPSAGINSIIEYYETDVFFVKNCYDIFTETTSPTFMIKQPNTDSAYFQIANRYYYPPTPKREANSIQLHWEKEEKQWASLILGIDEQIAETERALVARMSHLDLSQPNQYALQFAILGTEGQEQITVKFQDQNVLIQESLGNQVCHDILASTIWELHCIPLTNFKIDPWIKKEYGDTHKLDFEWENIKQINFDPHYYSESGTVYLDEIRIVQVSECDKIESSDDD